MHCHAWYTAVKFDENLKQTVCLLSRFIFFLSYIKFLCNNFAAKLTVVYMWFLQSNGEKIQEEVKENVQEMKSGFDDAWYKMWDKVDSWKDGLITNIPNIIIAVVVFTITVFISRYVYKLAMRLLRKNSMQHSAKKVIARVSSIFVVLLGLFLALLVLNLNNVVTTLLTGAGVAGLVVGLALQDTLTNTFSGITLSVIKQVKIGDWIECNGYEGEVVDIDFRVTTLREVDNNIVLMPNKMVINNVVKNTSIAQQKRVILKCGVAYGSDLQQVQTIVLDLVQNKVEKLLKDKDVLFVFREFGDSSINFELRYYVDTPSVIESMKIKSDFMIEMKKAFDENNIEIPFPMRTLDIPKETLKVLADKSHAKINDDKDQDKI